MDVNAGGGITMLDSGFEGLKQVQLWYVKGIVGVYYETKMQAEAEARKAFLFDNESQRYARIYYKTFMEEVK